MLKTLDKLLCGFLLTGRKAGCGGSRSSVVSGVGEPSRESTAQLFSRVGPRLMDMSGLLRMRDVLLPLTERKCEEYMRGFC